MVVGGRQSRDQVSTKKQEETEKTKNEHGRTRVLKTFEKKKKSRRGQTDPGAAGK